MNNTKYVDEIDSLKTRISILEKLILPLLQYNSDSKPITDTSYTQQSESKSFNFSNIKRRIIS